jgi:hypothetical protein
LFLLLDNSSSWKGCDASKLHDSEDVSKTEDSNGVHNELSTLDSCSFSSNNDDIYLDGSKLSFFSTPQKVNAEIHTPATNAPNLEGLGNENSSEHLSEAQNPAGGFQNSEVSSENFFQPNISDKDPKCAKNGNLVSIELSMSDECSLFQNSEGSVSSCNKISDSMSTAFEEKRQTTEMAGHARRKLITNIGSDVEFPSLSEWLKPPNSRTSDSAKSSDDDRPIIGMVAAHWKNEEQENCTPQWWDGNGIPNSTNKYKEVNPISVSLTFCYLSKCGLPRNNTFDDQDQKVSWHAMSFEERLEKALSEEKLLSQRFRIFLHFTSNHSLIWHDFCFFHGVMFLSDFGRKCSTGNTSQFSGVEGEECDTAASQHLRVAAFT